MQSLDQLDKYQLAICINLRRDALKCNYLDNLAGGSSWSKALCGWGDYTWQYHLATFIGVWVVSDFYEFFYHRMGHVDFRFWQQHKHHHVFYNPSPFSVIGIIKLYNTTN